jgi:ADP-ribose pyrophosphatase
MHLSKVETVFCGRAFDLRSEFYTLPDGSTSRFDILTHPGGSAIVPVDQHGNILLIRQYRPSIGRSVLEIPAGSREAGEDPAVTAQRELQEEAGVRGTLRALATFALAPGYSSEILHLYLATDLEPAPLPADNDEEIEIIPMTGAAALAAIQNGDICDAKSITGILLAHAIGAF